MKAPRRNHHRLSLLGVLTAAAACCLLVLGAASASASFGIAKWDGTLTANSKGDPAVLAGSHPYEFKTELVFNTFEEEGIPFPEAPIKDQVVELPQGFVANPNAVPKCTLADFYGRGSGVFESTFCPNSSAVGVVKVDFFGGLESIYEPIFNLVPFPGEPGKLGFKLISASIFFTTELRSDGDYGVTTTVHNTSEAIAYTGAEVTLWGVPADSSHDEERGSCREPFGSSGKECLFQIPPTKAPGTPFFTLPAACSDPLQFNVQADSWFEPGNWDEASFLNHDGVGNPVPVEDCEELDFAPRVESRASTDNAETGSGLDFNLDFFGEGLDNPFTRTESEAKKAEVILPEGVTINPSIGEGLGVCTPADLKRETLSSRPGEGCPDASKVGSLHLETPLVDEAVDGSVFLAQQDDPATAEPGAENPFDSLIALYFVLKNPTLGVIVKLPAKVEPDPKTGQLITTLDNIPQIPFNHFNLHLREGLRAPLVSPPSCGTYTTEAKLTPWSDPADPHTVIANFQITKGIGGGPCPPAGVPPFHPGFEAGSVNNNAKSFSPFDMRLTRADGEQDMTKFSSILPPGVLGKLAGVSECPDGAIANAATKTGRQELASPSCPANSQIGHTLAGAGVGLALTYVPGQIYLAGPYKGDPLSVVSVTPAVAGPFDAGTVVVRLALTLNPETAEVEVDGAASDPIPHILKGIVLKVRDLRVHVDRSNFILNPTSCDESSAKATLFGSYLDIFSPSDDVPVGLSTRYQAANCLNLPFEPRLSLKLNGGTKRGGHPALKAVLDAGPNDANIGSAVVTLPKSAFLEQGHIRTICTRVQFAAKACPPGAQYGYARAWTPLLDNPIEGPVYLRSSNHKLPDLVAALHGLVDVNVVGRIDSFKGGIRSSFETVPDAPVSKFILTMQGGKKGLVVNSRDLCAHKSRANAQFTGQNGILHEFHPVVGASCGGKGKG